MLLMTVIGGIASAATSDVPVYKSGVPAAVLANGSNADLRTAAYAPTKDSNGDYVLASAGTSNSTTYGNELNIYEVNPTTGAQTYMGGISNGTTVGSVENVYDISFAPTTDKNGNWVLAVANAETTSGPQVELFTIPTSGTNMDQPTYVLGSNTTEGTSGSAVGGNTYSASALAWSPTVNSSGNYVLAVANKNSLPNYPQVETFVVSLGSGTGTLDVPTYVTGSNTTEGTSGSAGNTYDATSLSFSPGTTSAGNWILAVANAISGSGYPQVETFNVYSGAGGSGTINVPTPVSGSNTTSGTLAGNTSTPNVVSFAPVSTSGNWTLAVGNSSTGVPQVATYTVPQGGTTPGVPAYTAGNNTTEGNSAGDTYEPLSLAWSPTAFSSGTYNGDYVLAVGNYSSTASYPQLETFAVNLGSGTGTAGKPTYIATSNTTEGNAAADTIDIYGVTFSPSTNSSGNWQLAVSNVSATLNYPGLQTYSVSGTSGVPSFEANQTYSMTPGTTSNATSTSYAPGTDANGDYVLAVASDTTSSLVDGLNIYEVNPTTGAETLMGEEPTGSAAGGTYNAITVSWAPSATSGNWMLAVANDTNLSGYSQVSIYTVPSSGSSMDQPSFTGGTTLTPSSAGNTDLPTGISWAPTKDKNSNWVLAIANDSTFTVQVEIFTVNPGGGTTALNSPVYVSGSNTTYGAATAGDTNQPWKVAFAPVKDSSGNWVLAVLNKGGGTEGLELFTVYSGTGCSSACNTLDVPKYVAGSNVTNGTAAGLVDAPSSLAWAPGVDSNSNYVLAVSNNSVGGSTPQVEAFAVNLGSDANVTTYPLDVPTYVSGSNTTEGIIPGDTNAPVGLAFSSTLDGAGNWVLAAANDNATAGYPQVEIFTMSPSGTTLDQPVYVTNSNTSEGTTGGDTYDPSAVSFSPTTSGVSYIAVGNGSTVTDYPGLGIYLLTQVAGSLTLTAPSSTVNFTGTDTGQTFTVTGSLGPWSVGDETSSGSGWNVSVAADPSTPQFSAYCYASADCSVGFVSGGDTLPLRSLELTTNHDTWAAGADGTGTAPIFECGAGCYLDNGSTSFIIAEAAAGTGEGTWNATSSAADLTLTVAGSVKVPPAGENYRLIDDWSITSGP